MTIFAIFPPPNYKGPYNDNRENIKEMENPSPPPERRYRDWPRPNPSREYGKKYYIVDLRQGTTDDWRTTRSTST